MTSSHRRHRRLRPRPTSAPPLEDDDLLDEILLRLSPDPSSLPRASAVCTRWRRLVSDPGFVSRFSLRHRLRPPILGCFITDQQRATVSFVPTLEAPNRLPAECFSLQLGDRGRFSILNCRHGLLLMLLPLRSKVLVWDPVTGEQHRLDIPPGLDTKQGIGGAVLRAGGAIRHFQTLTVVPAPSDMIAVGCCQILAMRAEDGGLGVLFKSDCNVQLWKRKIDCHGEASWVLGRTFELDTLLSLNSEKSSRCSKPAFGTSISHSKMSILEKQALVVDTGAELLNNT